MTDKPMTVGEFKHFLHAIPDDLELVICFSHKRLPNGFFDYRRPTYKDMEICPDMLVIDVANDKGVYQA